MNFHPSGLLGKTNITGKMNLNWKDSVPFCFKWNAYLFWLWELCSKRDRPMVGKKVR